MSKEICVFGGSNYSKNVIKLLRNIEEILGDDFLLSFVGNEGFDRSESSEFDKTRFYNRDSLVSGFFSLKRYVRDNRPDVLWQITDPPVHGSIVSLVGFVYDIPVVYRYSGNRFKEYKLEGNPIKKLLLFILNNLIGRSPLKLANNFITIGENGKRVLKSKGVPSDKIEVLPQPVDESIFKKMGNKRELRKKKGFTEDAVVGLYVGRFSKFKGTYEYLDATLEVLDEENKYHFVFIGDEPRKLKDRIPEEKKKFYTIINEVENKKLPIYYNLADFVVHSSFSEGGTPNVVMESLACETPVIARNSGDIGSIVSNTFRNKEEFLALLKNPDELELDDIDRFKISNLKSEYLDFFNSIV